MSWLVDIRDKMVIITGDRKEFRPDWLNATKGKPFNVASFNFIGVAGTLVKRSEPKGAQYKLEIYFQGNDHLDFAADFERSADDKRTWTLRHPFYGDLKVHPTDMIRDNTGYNISKFTINILETIDDINPQSTVVPQERIAQDKEDSDLIAAASFVNGNPEPDVKDINSMSALIDQEDISTSRIIIDDVEAETFRNIVNKAQANITNATGDALAAVRSIQEVINFPGRVSQKLEIRVRTLIDELDVLINSVIGSSNRNDKFLFENTGGGKITTLCETVTINLDPDDYKNNSAVFDVITLLLAAYDDYIDTLDALQTDDPDDVDSYTADDTTQLAINELVNFTLSSLFTIALNTKRERGIILEEDSDLINVVHRLLGLDAEDVNIDEFIDNNTIGVLEHLLIKKGRKLIYYI